MSSIPASADNVSAVVSEAAASQAVERGQEQTALPPPGCRTLVNMTNRRLEIADAEGTIVVPPLGSRRLEEDRASRIELGPLIDAGVLGVVKEPEPSAPLTANATPFVVAALAAASVVVGLSRDMVVDGILLALIIVVAAAAWALRTTLEWLHHLPLRLTESLNFVLMLAIVAALPGAILFFGSDVPRLFSLARHGSAAERNAATAIMIGVGLQWIFIVLASALPGLLYFLFDRERLRTLRERFTRQVFRLDGSVTSIADVNAKYGALLDEAYGRERGTERLLPGRRFPIVVATTAITLLTLLEPHLAEHVAQTSLVSLFTPVPRAVVYAFLGAYFFTLHHLLRGFMRGDLRPKSYAHVAVRVLSVTVLAFVLSKATAAAHGSIARPDEGLLLVIAFLTGVLPETALLRLQELGRGTVRGRTASLYETQPLTHLEGIDIYDRARLTDEGVTNVEALAHHDLVDLLLKTRIPVPRLVDWVDQAILYLHVGGGVVEDDATPKKTLELLRCYGIRTATDLEQAHRAARRAGREEQFLALLPSPCGAPANTPRLRVILDALRDEEWMDNLRRWHSAPAVARPIRYPADFADGLPDAA